MAGRFRRRERIRSARASRAEGAEGARNGSAVERSEVSSGATAVSVSVSVGLVWSSVAVTSEVAESGVASVEVGGQVGAELAECTKIPAEIEEVGVRMVVHPPR